MPSIFDRKKKPTAPKKTLQDHAEDALYREVWEDVNNEKTVNFLKKYYKPIIAAAIILLIAVVGVQMYRAHVKTSRIAAATTYETAIDNMDPRALAAMSKNTGGAMSDLALFQSYMLDGDVKKLDELVKNGRTRDFRDLGRIHLAGIRGDSMTPADFEKFLSPLDTKSSPFYYTGMLMVAQKYLAASDRANADKWLDKIINDAAAPSVVSATAQSLK